MDKGDTIYLVGMNNAWYAQQVVLPAAERRAAVEQELQLLKQDEVPARRWGVACWLGTRLVDVGEWLRGPVPMVPRLGGASTPAGTDG